MATRAKLRYEGVPYSEEVLQKICKYMCLMFKSRYIGYKLDRENELLTLLHCTDYGDIDYSGVIPEKYGIDFRALSTIPIKDSEPIINSSGTAFKYVIYRKDMWHLGKLLNIKYGKTFVGFTLNNTSKYCSLKFLKRERTSEERKALQENRNLDYAIIRVQFSKIIETLSILDNNINTDIEKLNLITKIDGFA